jgi:hypothetical protein
VGAPQSFIDDCEHSLEIPIDVIVPKAQHPITRSRQSIVAYSIPPRVRVEIVLTTVDLDHEPTLAANEIQYVLPPRRLTPKMEPTIFPGP